MTYNQPDASGHFGRFGGRFMPEALIAPLDELAAAFDPTDAQALAAAPLPLARRAVRRWLTVGGYPPDVAAVERVLAVARGQQVACEISPGIRVQRTQQRLRFETP